MVTKASLLVFRTHKGRKELLFVRAINHPYFIFPGGKKEEGETIDDALQRELWEELGTGAINVKRLGIVSGETPDGRPIDMYLFSGELKDEPQPLSEIEEMLWLDKSAVKSRVNTMTPMTLEHVLPFLEERKMW